MSKGTTLRNVRVPDELWDAALTRAQRDDTNLSEIIRQALTQYVDDDHPDRG
jgi:predicted HicB family RNase H-like nuclease